MRLFRIADRQNAVDQHESDGYADSLIPAADLLEDMPIEVSRYGERSWAVIYAGKLLCVTVYLKGAMAVQALIGQMQAELRRAKSEPAFPMVDPEIGDRDSPHQ